MTHMCNPSTNEAEAWEFWIQGQPGLLARSCFKKKKRQKTDLPSAAFSGYLDNLHNLDIILVNRIVPVLGILVISTCFKYSSYSS